MAMDAILDTIVDGGLPPRNGAGGHDDHSQSSLVEGIFPFSVEATADALFLSIGIILMYALRTSIRLRCWRTVILQGFFKLLII